MLERHQLREQSARLKQEVKELTRLVLLEKKRSDFVERIRDSYKPYSIPRREKKSGLREGIPVVLASDWHVEETVRPETIMFKNSFDINVADRRIARYFDGVEYLIRHHREIMKIHDMVLWLGGDLISGYIHEELEETNDLSPVAATLFLQPRLKSYITRLRDRLGINIHIPCNFGNHGRTGKKKRVSSAAANSYEYLMYRNLERLMADEPGITFDVSESGHCYVNTYDFVHRFHHGDSVRYWGGVGGVTIPLNKAIAQWQKFQRADYTNIGHFHQLMHTRDACINGSLIGYNAFALSIKAEYEDPQQAFYITDSRRGKCLQTPIWLSDEPVQGVNTGVQMGHYSRRPSSMAPGLKGKAWRDERANSEPSWAGGLKVDGEIDSLRGWSRRTGVSRDVITRRLKKGWSPREAVYTPPKPVPQNFDTKPRGKKGKRK